MPGKTHKSAVVLIPPRELWAPIQEIRRQRDRKFRRWMPHVTLLYPFRPRSDFDALAPALGRACASIPPFQVELAAVGFFRYRRGGVLWLAPDPPDPLRRLQDAVARTAPDCDDVRNFPGGFTPHLSLGQAGAEELAEAAGAIQRGWRAVRFRATQVSLIYRGEPPDDVFGVDRELPLGPAEAPCATKS